MNRPKFSKMYFPGLISLVFLPLMCVCYFLAQGKFNKYSKLDVVWADDESVTHFLGIRGKTFDINSFKNFVNDSINGDETHDKLVLTNFQREIERLSATADKNQAYSITFGKHSSYKNVVNTIDICESPLNKNYGFILFNNQALIWKAEPSKMMSLGAIDDRGLGVKMIRNVDLSDDVLSERQTIYQKFINSILSHSNETIVFWPSILALVMILYFAFNKKLRYLNLKTFRLVGH